MFFDFVGCELNNSCLFSVRSWSEVNFLFGEPSRNLIKGRGGEIDPSSVSSCLPQGGGRGQ